MMLHELCFMLCSEIIIELILRHCKISRTSQDERSQLWNIYKNNQVVRPYLLQLQRWFPFKTEKFFSTMDQNFFPFYGQFEKDVHITLENF
jgi:hypothetical protein